MDQKSVRIPYFLPHQNFITRACKRIAMVEGVIAQHLEYGLLSFAIHAWIDFVRREAIRISQAMNRWILAVNWPYAVHFTTSESREKIIKL